MTGTLQSASLLVTLRLQRKLLWKPYYGGVNGGTPDCDECTQRGDEGREDRLATSSGNQHRQ